MQSLNNLSEINNAQQNTEKQEYEKIQIMINNQYTNEFEGKTADLYSDLLKESFINKTHFFMASSGEGKTVFCAALISRLLDKFRNVNFWIYIFASTRDAYEKFITIKKNLDIDFNLSFTDKIENIMNSFYSIKSNFSNEKFSNKKFLFIFDDISQFLNNTKNAPFFSDLISNGRHLNITFIILSQIVKKIPDAIKNQSTTITLIGNQSISNCVTLYKHFPIISDKFTEQEFKYIVTVYMKKKLPKFTILFLKKETDILYFYKVSKSFLEFLENKKNSTSNFLSKKIFATKQKELWSKSLSPKTPKLINKISTDKTNSDNKNSEQKDFVSKRKYSIIDNNFNDEYGDLNYTQKKTKFF